MSQLLPLVVDFNRERGCRTFLTLCLCLAGDTSFSFSSSEVDRLRIVGWGFRIYATYVVGVTVRVKR